MTAASQTPEKLELKPWPHGVICTALCVLLYVVGMFAGYSAAPYDTEVVLLGDTAIPFPRLLLNFFLCPPVPLLLVGTVALFRATPERKLSQPVSLVLVAALIFLPGSAWVVLDPTMREILPDPRLDSLKVFDSQLEGWAAETNYDVAEGQPYISGKVVILDIGKYQPDYRQGAIYQVDDGIRRRNETDPTTVRIDPIYFGLPIELQAHSPEEVNTLVLLEWARVVIARYNNGSTISQVSCDVTVIDLGRQLIIDRLSFTGSRPDTPEVVSSVSGGTSHTYGSLPTYEILNYLKSLDRN